MELRYCEECGDVLQVETDQPLALNDHFVCEQCRNGAGTAKAAGAGPTAVQQAAMQAQNLNLFSPETIAIRKKQYDEESPTKKPKSSRLRLVKPGAPPPAGTEAPADPLADRAWREPSTTVGSQAGSQAGSQRGSQAGPQGGALQAAGCASPAKSARRILFRCLHCRSTLSIRPVEKTSKLTCPHCAKVIYVTPTGRLLKNSPSVAIRKGEVPPTEMMQAGDGAMDMSVIERNAGSVAIKKPGSTVTVPKSGAARKSGSSVGLRLTAYPEAANPLVSAGAESGSARLVKSRSAGGSGRSSVNQPSEDVPLKSVNPATSWMPKPASAFREHQENQDPGKTAFLTDEGIGDLSDLTSPETLAGVAEQFMLPGLKNAPPEPSPGLGALLPDESDLLDERGTRRGGRSAFKDEAGYSGRGRSLAAEVCRPGLLQYTVRGLFLMACICIPLLMPGLILTKKASATGSPDPVIESAAPASILHNLGTIALDGVRKLLGTRAPEEE